MINCSNRIVSSFDVFPLIKEDIMNGYRVKFTVSGNSMRPWIAHNRDQVLLTGTEGKKLKLGSIILFRNKNGKYILHRIYKKKGEDFFTIGDFSLHGDGRVQRDQIIGVVETICRKGKDIDCNSVFWRFVFTLWRRLLPIRGALIRLYINLLNLKNKKGTIKN